jgi:hypothetical protein
MQPIAKGPSLWSQTSPEEECGSRDPSSAALKKCGRPAPCTRSNAHAAR